MKKRKKQNNPDLIIKAQRFGRCAFFYIYLYCFRFINSIITVTTTASDSATITEYHIPSSPHISGNSITDATWKTSVLKKDMKADVSPALSAVKNAEPNIPAPTKIKEITYTLNPCTVML